jgi:hypothetical protein
MRLMLAAALVCAAVSAQPPSQREQLKQRMKDHPDEPWPPMRGHIVLASPGSRMDQKGYHEPGAWFSPAPGSFGITLLPQPKDGSELTQRLDGFSVLSETPSWTARWSVAGECSFTLAVDPLEPGVRLRIQSAGPAGGPVRSIEQLQGAVVVDGEWSISPVADAEPAGLGDWLSTTVPLPDKRTIAVKRLGPCAPSPIKAGPGVDVNVPDQRFIDSLNAQVAHLMMGLTGEETRPGETVNYPLAWLRDGSYSLVALARSGQIGAARVLSKKFAEQDFFGGFGPEADAPGLSLWALEEVAARAKDPKYDAYLWPHVYRKAEFIIRMRHTETPIREVVRGPIVPSLLKDPELDLVCEPARDGLIIGRMDHHRPVLFVNAVSYAGLLNAAELAERIGAKEPAARWRGEATEIRGAWWRAFGAKAGENERTFIVGLWPTWIAATHPGAYRDALQANWTKTRKPDGGFVKRPEWTYFDVAQAHNWLLLGDQDKAWQTLEYFWANQPSPGLYTLWEGSGEENNFGLWQQIRGWADPPFITPHYWSASEMLNLQLDMLAYVDEVSPDMELVIGAGVPPEWIQENMSVKGIRTRFGVVDWTWRAGKLAVTLDGKPARFRPAGAFAPRR